MRGRLEQAGFSVIDTESGLDGLRAFADADVDVVLVDVGLPDIDGFSVVRLIREKSLVPIMMMTAATDEIDRCGRLRHQAIPAARVGRESSGAPQTVGPRRAACGRPHDARGRGAVDRRGGSRGAGRR